MVVLVIITFITLVVLTSQSNFNKSLILANTAYDVALTFRTAEIFGLGSRVSDTASNVGYGLHFTMTNTSQFTLFIDADPVNTVNNGPDKCHSTGSIDPNETNQNVISPDAKAGNCVYNGAVDQNVQTYTLGNKITINRLCAGGKCSDQAQGPQTVDIVFSRPNPMPAISVDGVYSKVANISAACIELVSPDGQNTRAVTITSSGQVTVSQVLSQCS